MYEDSYAEWLVKRKDPWWNALVYLGLGVVVLLALILLMNWKFGIIALAAAIIIILFTFRYLKVAYEYTFVIDELRIDRIYSDQIRKNALKVEMTALTSVEPTNEERNALLREDKNIKFKDFSSQEKDAKTYTIDYTEGGQRYIVVFEPNEKLLRTMWRKAPSKVHMG